MNLDEKVKPSHAALLVIDMQNDFCSQEGIAFRWQDHTAVRSLIPRLREFLDKARSKGIRIIFVRTVRGPEDVTDVMKEIKSRHGRKGEACVRGTWGAEFINDIRPQNGETVIEKKKYSAFFGTDLDARLRSLGVRALILTGVMSNVCVETTARDGFMRDYFIVFSSDLTATFSEQLHAAALSNIDNTFGQVVSSEELFKAWET